MADPVRTAYSRLRDAAGQGTLRQLCLEHGVNLFVAGRKRAPGRTDEDADYLRQVSGWLEQRPD